MHRDRVVVWGAATPHGCSSSDYDRRMRSRHLPSLGVILLLSAGCGGADDSATPEATAECSYPDSPQPAAAEVSPPPGDPDVEGAIAVTINTSVGELTAELDADAAPCTVNSFASLAEQGYYDGTTCHRLTTGGIFVLQCGDPTATGSGSPGYTFADELTGEEEYVAGTLAMANGGPDTNGSQFFIVYQDSDAGLDPLYTVFGRLDDESTSAVVEVAEEGTDSGLPDGAPKTPVDVSGVSLG